MSQYKYELAQELLQFLEDHPTAAYDDRLFDTFQQFPNFTDPKKAWDFLRRADFLGTTLPLLLDLDNKPTSILDWARYIKSRDAFALVADCTTNGEACSKLEDYIYGLEHGEAA